MSMLGLDARRVHGVAASADPPPMDLMRRLRAAVPTPDRASSERAPRRPGYDATHAQTLARVEPMLAAEPVVWLSTVRPDGLPHLVPTWFWWDGDAVVVYSKPDAVKVRNLRANPRLMIALGRPGRGLLRRADRGAGHARRQSRRRPRRVLRQVRRPARGRRPRSRDVPRDVHAGDPDRPDPVPRVARSRRRALGRGTAGAASSGGCPSRCPLAASPSAARCSPPGPDTAPRSRARVPADRR